MLKLNLSGKLAVVTGATGELGRVMVRTLAGCGANVVIQYLRNKEKAEQLQNELEQRGVKALAVRADVTSHESLLIMQRTILGTLGTPEIIINNAVAQYKWTSVLEQDVADYEGQFRSCVLHNVFMAKLFVPGMIKKGGGRIIAISTECVMQNLPSQSAYVSGKRGMDGLLRVLAREIGEHQITVNQVAPGWTISERDRRKGTEKNADYDKLVPLHRRGTDQEVANVVTFLASDLASYITGAYIPVSGGTVMPAI